MTPDSGLILPSLVPVEHKLILSPEAERQRQLDAIAEAEESYDRSDHDDTFDGPPPELSERCRLGVCHACGHQRLVFVPAMLCERCLSAAAKAEGLDMPPPASFRRMNRAERRKQGKQRG